jgi:ribosome biogenesis GTPase
VVERFLPRSSLLYRSNQYRKKLLAANVTQIIIVLAEKPSYYPELLNRCLIAAESEGIRPLILLNKTDLPESETALERLKPYTQLGYHLLGLCAQQDIAPLLPWLQDQTSVLVGQSGMGKSTLVNALLPGALIRTREISAALDSGKHTTTAARLYHLNQDSHLIDSPGLQEFGLAHLSAHQIEYAFIEFRPYIGKCRFNDCHHLSEPDCAMRAAVAKGAISEERLQCYHKVVAQPA